MTQNYKIGLALGCGASRGWAHIGAIEALEEAGIPIHLVAGCSVGAFVGAVYTSGGLEQLKQHVLEMDGERLFSFSDLTFLRPGLLDGDKKLRDLFGMHSSKKAFEELEKPLKVVACDMHSGDPVVLDTGDLLKALRASMSYPGVFAPVFHKGRWLIDGGVVDPVPVGVTRAMGADIVIAVNLDSELVSRKHHRRAEVEAEAKTGSFGNEFLQKLSERYSFVEKIFGMQEENQKKQPQTTPGTTQVINAAIGLMQERITRVNFAVNPPDILITPRLGDLKMFDYDQVEHAVEEGYVATRNQVNDIKLLLEKYEASYR
ncbi:MAG: patatin-like phospholipase family protein [Desulfobacterales bacterium]|nr:patatin-like phospholipase family protein [Desulfobacterales bacterium]